MAGAEIDVALIINRTRPNIGLLSVVDLVQFRRQHQDARVADRHSASIALEQFGAATGFPQRRLSGLGAGEHDEHEQNDGSNGDASWFVGDHRLVSFLCTWRRVSEQWQSDRYHGRLSAHPERR